MTSDGDSEAESYSKILADASITPGVPYAIGYTLRGYLKLQEHCTALSARRL